MNRIRLSLNQIVYAKEDLDRIINRKYWRWINIWFSPLPWIIISYRCNRAGFLLTGKYWSGLRLFFFPLEIVIRLFGGTHEVHFRTDIGPGLQILHPTLGVVISGSVICGKNLTLTGGNCIGVRKQLEVGDLVLGDDIYFGANAAVLGPAKIGDNVTIGAGAVVVNDFPAGSILVGVPAIRLEK